MNEVVEVKDRFSKLFNDADKKVSDINSKIETLQFSINQMNS
jgi:hypothetical protein